MNTLLSYCFITGHLILVDFQKFSVWFQSEAFPPEKMLTSPAYLLSSWSKWKISHCAVCKSGKQSERCCAFIFVNNKFSSAIATHRWFILAVDMSELGGVSADECLSLVWHVPLARHTSLERHTGGEGLLAEASDSVS